MRDSNICVVFVFHVVFTHDDIPSLFPRNAPIEGTAIALLDGYVTPDDIPKMEVRARNNHWFRYEKLDAIHSVIYIKRTQYCPKCSRWLCLARVIVATIVSAGKMSSKICALSCGFLFEHAPCRSGSAVEDL